MESVWIAAGILCLVYYAVINLYSGTIADASWIWLLGAMAILVSGWIEGRVTAGTFPELLRTAVGIAWIMLVIVLLILFVIVFRHMRDGSGENLKFLIILGAHVDETVPSRSLGKRIEKASEYAKQHPSVCLILSGGKGKGESISEAECMFRVLRDYGISEGRLLLEDKSSNTYENLVFSDRLSGCAEYSCGIVSNDFHISRALMIASRCGYKKAVGIAAPSDHVMELHYIMREMLAILAGKMRGIL